MKEGRESVFIAFSAISHSSMDFESLSSRGKLQSIQDTLLMIKLLWTLLQRERDGEKAAKEWWVNGKSFVGRVLLEQFVD